MSFASTIKRAFFHERYSRPDALPRSLIERFVALPRLTGILPYVGWLADERMFVLDQGGFGATEQFSIGFAIEVAPQNPKLERKIAENMDCAC